MVTRARAWLGGAGVLAALLSGSTCKVVNEDHCANQDVPGNRFCRELNRVTPYCSPCRRSYYGCVDYEPFTCEGYADEVEDDDPAESSTSDAGSGSDDAPTGTSTG
jgi:hypothetical protein